MKSNKKFIVISSILITLLILFLAASYLYNSLKFWDLCNSALSKHFSPKCQFAVKYGLEEEVSSHPDISYKDLILAKNRVDSILEKDDPRLKTDLPVESWPVFKHPQGLYTIRYNPNLKPVVTPVTKTEFTAYDIVDFEPIDANDQYGNFGISIAFDKGGGGSLCANAECYNARALGSLQLIDINAFNTYIGGEERLTKDTSTIVVFELDFEPRKDSKYLGRISSSYETGNQREVLKQMLGTLELNPEAFESDPASTRKEVLIKDTGDLKYYIEWKSYELPEETSSDYTKIYNLNVGSNGVLKEIDSNGDVRKTTNLYVNVSDEKGDFRMSVSAPSNSNLVTLKGNRAGTDGIDSYILDLDQAKIIDQSTDSGVGD